MSRIKVLIADDQELFATGIEIILKGPGQDLCRVVGKARDGREACEMVRLYRPDVVLMDIRMPRVDGVEATKRIHERYPEVKILILTTFDDDQYVFEALNNGALGYVLKDVSEEDLLTSIKAVYLGNFHVSPSIGYKLVKRVEEGSRAIEAAETQYQGELNYLASCFDSLSMREVEILHWLMLDYDNHQIAERLCIAEQTVKNRVSSIYAKLGVSDRTHAKRYVNQLIAAHGRG